MADKSSSASAQKKKEDLGIETGTRISPNFPKHGQTISTKIYHSDIPFDVDITKNPQVLLPTLQSLADPNEVTINNEGLLLEWFYSPILGQPRNVNINNLRLLAQSSWIAINIQNITRRISNLDWAILPKPEWKDKLETDPALQRKLKEIREFFQKPNNQNQSFEYLLSGYLRTLLEVDAGVFVKVFDKGGRLKELQVRDGATFVLNVDMHGNFLDPAYYQYSFIRPQATPIPFKMREVVYGIMNPQSGSPYGKAPTQYIEDVANILMDGITYNKNFFERNQIPSTIFWTTAHLNEESKNRLKTFLEKEVPKNPNAMYLLDNLPDLSQINLTLNQRDAEFLNSQNWFSKMTMMIFGSTPAVLGLTEDVNKAAQAGQESIFYDSAILPITKHIATKINREIMPEFFVDSFDVPYASIDFDMVPFEFKFFVRNRFTEEREKEGDRRDVQLGLLTPNEYRRKWDIEDGKPVPGGNLPHEGGAGLGGLQGFGSLFAAAEKNQKKRVMKTPENLEPIDPAPKRSIPDDDLVVSFQEQLTDLVVAFRSRVRTALDENRLGKKYKKKAYVKKNLDMFISSVQLAVTEFKNGLKLIVESNMQTLANQQIAQLEIEFNTAIPNDSFDAIVADLTNQLLNGYALPDGTFYGGVLELPDRTQAEIVNAMRTGVDEGLSEKTLTENLEPIFEGTAHTAQAFARTEIARASTIADLNGWQASGVVKRKRWVTAGDNRVRNNHAALNNVTVALGDSFKAVNDKGVLVEINGPPLDVNCRCKLLPVVD